MGPIMCTHVFTTNCVLALAAGMLATQLTPIRWGRTAFGQEWDIATVSRPHIRSKMAAVSLQIYLTQYKGRVFQF
jgi:hypothetical protein